MVERHALYVIHQTGATRNCHIGKMLAHCFITPLGVGGTRSSLPRAHETPNGTNTRRTKHPMKVLFRDPSTTYHATQACLFYPKFRNVKVDFEERRTKIISALTCRTV
jgi:hypothetical protein